MNMLNELAGFLSQNHIGAPVVVPLQTICTNITHIFVFYRPHSLLKQNIYFVNKLLQTISLTQMVYFCAHLNSRANEKNPI